MIGTDSAASTQRPEPTGYARAVYAPLQNEPSPFVWNAGPNPATGDTEGFGSPKRPQARIAVSVHCSSSTTRDDGATTVKRASVCRHPPADAAIVTPPARRGCSTPAESTVATVVSSERQRTTPTSAGSPRASTPRTRS